MSVQRELSLVSATLGNGRSGNKTKEATSLERVAKGARSFSEGWVGWRSRDEECAAGRERGRVGAGLVLMRIESWGRFSVDVHRIRNSSRRFRPRSG